MLETERIYFRPYQSGDLDFVISLWRDPEVVRYIGDGKIKTKAEIQEIFSRWVEKRGQGFGLHLAVLKQTGEYLGHAGIVPQEVDGKMEWEIGYWLAKKYWGQGYASEAAAAFRDYAFTKLKIKRLVCIIQPDHLASIKVAEKIGMSKEKETLFQSIPVVIYSIEK
ncbi:GNAT family N-acetyltransferase [Paenactinomyces guangxiensis]|uniref:GNAT family N-acetyltransferase n=1 Tax=Paenactinomyces guangxiensis TaxID=1490290 RepID=A0A7W2A9Z2_9BACL|nr:GNAT family N-acetyltransferase [Paenactinomyces guangxiensis]MBA4495739.1 GNAT family N-acetyltransferase [Paenactinomyces guangxiensis]MBH8592728.1 GNAT family N-acetyltransferase [Paenactinomyces guangxiensis]